MKNLAPLFFLALAACPDPGNPAQLWIALDGVMLELTAEEPDPF